MIGTRRISVTRLLVVLAGVAAVSVLATAWVSDIAASGDTKATPVSFAPYVDVTLTPTLHFEDPSVQPASSVILGFIVADPADPCRPSWGTFYGLDAAGRALDLDRRIVRLRERGGSAIVSFGGAFNDELATVCEDDKALDAAYGDVIDRYHTTIVDFDIEGAALGDTKANRRRAESIARVQAERPNLKVWLTVPITTGGVPDVVVDLIDSMLDAGVGLGGVNAMTMNYNTLAADVRLRDANEAALVALWRQLDSAYRRAGTTLTEPEVWQRIAATPMIGQNDVASERFTIDDARALRRFAASVGLGRLSMWSANRDHPCGASTSDGRVSNTCSGVDQKPFEFSALFAEQAPEPAVDSKLDNVATSRRPAAIVDDPRTSPYPLWRSAKAYTVGEKVVWQDRVYEAKWYSQGDQPDAPVRQVWETPWRYLGPVLDIDRAAVAQVRAKDGDRPLWSPERVYIAGDEVVLGNQAFQARWWTQGNRPLEDPDQPYDHPWLHLGEVVRAADSSVAARQPVAHGLSGP